MIIISHTDLNFRTALTSDKVELVFFLSFFSFDFINKITNSPFKKTINEQNKMTYLNAFLR